MTRSISKRRSKKTIPYSKEKALLRDVDSLSAVIRLRQGKQYYRYEECRALFVTTNSLLAHVSNTHLCSISGSVEIFPRVLQIMR